jgi:hypothetical protein
MHPYPNVSFPSPSVPITNWLWQAPDLGPGLTLADRHPSETGRFIVNGPRSLRRLTVKVFLVLVAVPLTAWVAQPALASNVVNATFHVPAMVETNPCFPTDVINLNGDIHIVITATADGRGSYRVKNHLNSHLSGTSITTGTNYVASETSNDTWRGDPPFPVVHTQTYTWVLVSQGRTPNYVLRMTMRETLDAGNVGDPTADGWSMDCQR